MKSSSGLAALAPLAIAVLALGPTTSGAAEAGPCGASYTVRTGDTMGAIAMRCATSVKALMQANPQVSDPARISIGQDLAVPTIADAADSSDGADAPDAVAAEWARRRDAAAVPLLAAGNYTVEAGDDMASIATKLGVPLRDLLAANEETDPFALQPGQVLALPDPDDLEAIEAPPNEAPTDAAAGDPDAAGDEAAAAPAGTEAGTGEPDRYTVQPGDSLGGIAAKAGVPLDALIAANEGVKPRALRPGQSLMLPAAGRDQEAAAPASGGARTERAGDDAPAKADAGAATGASRRSAPRSAPGTGESEAEAPGRYTVEPGDSLARIAAKTGVPLDALVAANERVKPRALRPGQSLVLPEIARDEDADPGEGAAGTETEAGAEPGDQESAGAGDETGDRTAGRMGGSGDPAGAGTGESEAEATGRYTVEPGDSLAGIAARTGVRLAELMAVNEGVEPRALRPGQELVLPGGARDADTPGRAEGGTELAAVPDADARPEPGGATAAPAEAAPEPMRLEGRIRKGVECPVLKTPDGRTYSLVSQAYGFTPGDYVAIEAEPVEVSFCMQGQTVRVTSMKSRPAPQGG